MIVVAYQREHKYEVLEKKNPQLLLESFIAIDYTSFTVSLSNLPK